MKKMTQLEIADTEFDFELQPVASRDRATGFDEPGAGGFSLLPDRAGLQRGQNGFVPMIRDEKFTFK